MKVSKLIEALNRMNPDDEVCAIILTKDLYDFDESDGLVLTDEGWSNLVDEFDELELIDLYQWMDSAAIDHSVQIKESE